MNKQDIINYVIETPSNTNKAVLKSMLDIVIENESAAAAEEAGEIVIIPRQFITINNADVEVANVDVSKITVGQQLLGKVIIFSVVDETNVYAARQAYGEYISQDRMAVGFSYNDEELGIIIYKDNDVWKLKVVDSNQDYVNLDYAIEIVASDILDMLELNPDWGN